MMQGIMSLRVQYTFTHKQYTERHKTNNTYNTKIRKSASRATSSWVLLWHLPYNWGKITREIHTQESGRKTWDK